MTVESITTTSGHMIVPGKWTHHQEPTVIMVPLTQGQLVALVEASAVPQEGHWTDWTTADDALWAALEQLDENLGYRE